MVVLVSDHSIVVCCCFGTNKLWVFVVPWQHGWNKSALYGQSPVSKRSVSGLGSVGCLFHTVTVCAICDSASFIQTDSRLCTVFTDHVLNSTLLVYYVLYLYVYITNSLAQVGDIRVLGSWGNRLLSRETWNPEFFRRISVVSPDPTLN